MYSVPLDLLPPGCLLLFLVQKSLIWPREGFSLPSTQTSRTAPSQLVLNQALRGTGNTVYDVLNILTSLIDILNILLDLSCRESGLQVLNKGVFCHKTLFCPKVLNKN